MLALSVSSQRHRSSVLACSLRGTPVTAINDRNSIQTQIIAALHTPRHPPYKRNNSPNAAHKRHNECENERETLCFGWCLIRAGASTLRRALRQLSATCIVAIIRFRFALAGMLSFGRAGVHRNVRLPKKVGGGRRAFFVWARRCSPVICRITLSG